MKRKIDILWFVEHVAREMDVACAVKALGEERYGMHIVIRNMYHRADETMRLFDPKIIVWPFFYYSNGAVAVEDYVKVWPRALHFNLSWEELYYKALIKPKAPSDEFAKNNVIHHAWGIFFKDYLIQSGVPENHIFVNGNPACQLYREPYRHYFKSRSWLAEKYNLSPSSRWVFFPENYRWAFGSKIALFSKLGGDRKEMVQMQDFCVESLKIALKWCNIAASHNDISVIFRPRPATNSKVLEEFFYEFVGKKADRLLLIKEETVREWILASDVIFSSFSTSLIEASIACKPTYMVEPIRIPESLYHVWYEHVPRIRTLKEFLYACHDSVETSNSSLMNWAQTHLLANGDPILGLVEFMHNLLNLTNTIGPGRRRLSIIGDLFRRTKNYFNLTSHEKDEFDEQDVNQRVEQWKKVLVTAMDLKKG